jgi:hypothetical protein
MHARLSRSLKSVYFLNLFLLSFAVSSFKAEARPTFGAEFEFTNWPMMEDDNLGAHGLTVDGLEEKAARAFRAKVMEKCPTCQIVDESYKFGMATKVIYPDGWWFRISMDPSCVEIQTKPATHAELTAISDRIDDHIFETAGELGLFPDEDTGAGHLNFGATSTFGDDPNLFLSYAADFANHPELSHGAWGLDRLNAPAMSELKQTQRDAFLKIMKDARAKKIATTKDAAYRVESEVYTETTMPGGRGAYHYQAMSVKRLNNANFPTIDAPVEIRSIYPQFGASDFIKLSELVEKRVAYLKKNNSPLIYLNLREKNLRPQVIVDRYYAYLSEMGASWKRYRSTMGAQLQYLKPGDFVKGKITWAPEYTTSAMDFVPQVKTSPWIRKKLYDALTDPKAVSSKGANRVLMEIVDSIKPGSPALQTEIDFMASVLNSPTWEKASARNGIIRTLESKIPSLGNHELSLKTLARKSAFPTCVDQTELFYQLAF